MNWVHYYLYLGINYCDFFFMGHGYDAAKMLQKSSETASFISRYSLRFQTCSSLREVEGVMDEFEMYAQWIKQVQIAEALKQQRPALNSCVSHAAGRHFAVVKLQ